MNLRLHLILPFFVILFIASINTSLASIVELHSGKKIEGEIVHRDEESIKIDTGIGVAFTYYLDEILLIDDEKISLLAPETIDLTTDENKEINEISKSESQVKPIETSNNALQAKNLDKDFKESISIIPLKPIVLSSNADPAEQPVSENIQKGTETSQGKLAIQMPAKVSIPSPVKPVVKSIDQVKKVIEPPLEVKKAEIIAEKRASPVKDISVIKSESPLKESPSPFGPTIRDAKEVSQSPVTENPAPKGSTKTIKETSPPPPVKPQVTQIDQFMNKQIKSFGKMKIIFIKSLENMQQKLQEAPLRVRQDMLLIGSLFVLGLYLLVCIPLTIIAKKLGRKHVWLVWIPVAQILYVTYIAEKPLLWNLFYCVPIVQVMVPFVLCFAILKTLSRSAWFIIPMILPGINILILWYLAFTKGKGFLNEKI